jgi:hypothetical protein
LFDVSIVEIQLAADGRYKNTWSVCPFSSSHHPKTDLWVFGLLDNGNASKEDVINYEEQLWSDESFVLDAWRGRGSKPWDPSSCNTLQPSCGRLDGIRINPMMQAAIRSSILQIMSVRFFTAAVTSSFGPARRHGLFDSRNRSE